MTKTLSLKILKDAMKKVNDDPALRKLGSCDAVMGIKIGKKCFAVTFEAFECAGVEEIEEDSLRDVDFYIEMTKAAWESFLTNLGSESSTNLNELDIQSGIIKSSDARKRLTFCQYHLSFQHFFEQAAA